MSASAREHRDLSLSTAGRLVVGLFRRTRWNFLSWVWMVVFLMGALGDKGGRRLADQIGDRRGRQRLLEGRRVDRCVAPDGCLCCR